MIRFLHCQKGRYRRTRLGSLRKLKRIELNKPRHISNRPKHIDNRSTYGHWGGDTIVGKTRSGYIVTIVERKSGYLAARLLTKQDFGATGFAQKTALSLGGVPEEYKKTLTLDNGPEMGDPEQIEMLTGFKVYYANPYHSWERGTNENTNGLLRYFFPKKMSFAHLTQADIDQAVELLNNRPRKRLGWRSPAEMFKF